MIKINDFWIAVLGYGKFDQGEFANDSPETLGSILGTHEPKNSKKKV